MFLSNDEWLYEQVGLHAHSSHLRSTNIVLLVGMRLHKVMMSLVHLSRMFLVHL